LHFSIFFYKLVLAIHKVLLATVSLVILDFYG
jgi:hypothetical protein